jgi:hypothetical protein
VLCLLISPGAFWVLRNVMHTGNPLWPVTLAAFGQTVFPGQATMAQVLDVAHNTPKEIAALPGVLRTAFTWLQLSGPAVDFDDRLAGLGYAWPLFALPALGSVLAQRLRAKQQPRQQPPQLAPAVPVILLTALCLVLQPMNWWPRYTLWLWGAGALALAVCAEGVVSSNAKDAETWVQRALVALLVVSGSEGIFALCHVQGAHLALRRWQRAQDLAAVFDVRRGFNAVDWVAPAWWQLGLEQQGHVCRGGWKPGTDNTNLDGVFAQLHPRPRVHWVEDEGQSWPAARKQALANGCPALPLFPGSPVLASALQDPSVSVEKRLAFDPLFVVSFSKPRTPAPNVRAGGF